MYLNFFRNAVGRMLYDMELGIKIQERTTTEMGKIVKADGKKIHMSGEHKT